MKEIVSQGGILVKMREKKRIKRILKLLEKLWTDVSDERFGQFLINLQIVPDDFNVWNNEDDGLEKYLEKLWNSKK